MSWCSISWRPHDECGRGGLVDDSAGEELLCWEVLIRGRELSAAATAPMLSLRWPVSSGKSLESSLAVAMELSGCDANV